jgi:hypothetical protein
MAGLAHVDPEWERQVYEAVTRSRTFLPPGLVQSRVEDCEGCGNGMPADECRLSPRFCGHHCDCSWDQDHCCFCGEEFGEHQDYPKCYDCVGMGV